MKENYCVDNIAETSFDYVYEKACMFENKCGNKNIEVYFNRKEYCLYFFNMDLKFYAKTSIPMGGIYNIKIYNEDGYISADHSVKFSDVISSIISNFESQDENEKIRYIINDILSIVINHPIFNNAFKNNKFISFMFHDFNVISKIFKLKKNDEIYYEINFDMNKNNSSSKIIIIEIDGELSYTLLEGFNAPNWLSSLNKTLLYYFDMQKISLMQTESGKIKFLIDGLKFNSNFFYDQENHCLSGSVIEYHNGYASDKVQYEFKLERNFENCGREIFDTLSNNFLYKYPNMRTIEKLIEFGVYDEGDKFENSYITLLEMIEY